MKGGFYIDRTKEFCEYCRKDVNYITTVKLISATLDGENYNYFGKLAICNECNKEIYVNEINDYNLLQLYNELRIYNDIISLEKIRKIPVKYNIEKRQLSLILGWGDQTFSRYFEGDIPKKQHSAILEKIYEDTNFLLSILKDKNSV